MLGSAPSNDRSAAGHRALREQLLLYVVLDRELSRGRDLVTVAQAALAGGAGCIQVRGKDCSGRELYELTATLRPLTAAARALLIVNDRVDIALAAGADGVHLGQSDLHATAARRLLGAGKVLGLSVGSVAEALAGVRVVDYLSVSPVFATPTKPEAGAGLGLDLVGAIAAAAAPLPVIGIGGLSAANAAACLAAGAVGIAVVSAVVSAPDVEAAARQLRQVLRQAHIN